MAPHTVSSSSSKKWIGRSVGRHTPALLPVGVGPGELGQRHEQDPVDLVGAGRSRWSLGEPGDDRDDVAAAHHRAEVIELADDLDERRVEGDLLVGLPDRRVHRGLTGVEPAAGEADLTMVVAQVPAPGG